MNAFLGELAKKLADKWLTLLVLPGLLFLATGAAGRTLGHRDWTDAKHLIAAANRLAATLNQQGPIAVGLVLIGMLLASGATGLATRGLALVVQRVWLGQWPPAHRFPTRQLAARRRRRWLRLQDQCAALAQGTSTDQVDAVHVAAARNRIALSTPNRATWMGDRMTSVERRVHGQYGLDLVSAWPRLWLVVPDATRTELRDAHNRLDGATALAAWGMLYLLLGAWWWPAALAGGGVLLTGWRTGRTATAELAQLIEATVDLYGRDLAVALGFSTDDERLTHHVGEKITRQLRKGA